MSSTSEAVLGSVLSLWRYPVKSMMGEELNAAAFTERGLAGDRVYALVDPTNGKVASAKNPRKWAKLCKRSVPRGRAQTSSGRGSSRALAVSRSAR